MYTTFSMFAIVKIQCYNSLYFLLPINFDGQCLQKKLIAISQKKKNWYIRNQTFFPLCYVFFSVLS